MVGLIRIGWLGALTLVATTPAVHAQLASQWAEQAAAEADDQDHCLQNARDGKTDSPGDPDTPQLLQSASPDVWNGLGDRSETVQSGSAMLADLLGHAPRQPLTPTRSAIIGVLPATDRTARPAHVWISCRYAHAPPAARPL